MPEELDVGESLVTSDDGDLRVETTRTDEHLFTRTYRDADTGELRLALQVDVTTGRTAIDPRSFDRAFWTVIADEEERPGEDLEAALAAVDDPSIEVHPERREIRVYVGEE